MSLGIRTSTFAFSAWKTYGFVMAGHTPSDDGDTDWRRLASDRNVSPGVARALWEQARAAAPDDPVQAEHEFHVMLDEAEAASITQEPGRETLASSPLSPRDVSALGPGKWTRVLLEQPKPPGPAGFAQRGAETAKQPSAERLRNELVAAGQAGKHAAALLAASDPATIVEALRQLGGRQAPDVLQKIMSVAGGAVERILGQRSQAPSQAPPTQAGPAPQAPPTQAGPAPQGTNAGNQGAPGTLDRALATPPDRKR
jgi:hypothetical protein